MKKQNYQKIIGIGFILVGIVFLLNQPLLNLTGHAISENIKKFIGSIFGLVLIIVGIFFMMSGREEGEGGLEYSVNEAMKVGVPKKEAKKLLKELNEKISSNEWIELRTFRVRDTTNPEKYPQATSLCRYWGPPEYKDYSNKKLLNLYLKNEIGKTHELVLGSEKYKIGGSLDKETVSIPSTGSKVLHRHWEIGEMYKYKKRNKK